MSMYKIFETDPELETKGVVVDYGDFRVTVARAGGANKRYAKVAETRSRPYRRAIENELLPNDRANELLMEIYAEAAVLNWEVNKGTQDSPTWVQGIEARDGTILPFTYDNIMLTFRALPLLYEDLQKQSSKAALYRRELLEVEAKN